MNSKKLTRYRATRKATLIGASANIILAVSKVLFGWLGHSSALVADGIHSFSDLLTDLLVILAAKFAHYEADAEHPYGHERIETAATVALSLLLVFVGLAIVYDGIHDLLKHARQLRPQVYVLWIAIFSVILNEIIYRYTLAVSKRIDSDMLKANALHSRSDAASSLVVVVGVAGSLLGVSWLDAAAAVVVGVLIVRMGAMLGWRNISELIDTGVDEHTLKIIRDEIAKVPGIVSIHQLRTRKMAGQILVDVHVIVDNKISVSEGHHIGDQVLSVLYGGVDKIHDVSVHVDSEDDELYSLSASLPLREKLLPQLRKAWQDLPGASEIQNITLHYLAGKIEVDVTLPVSVLQVEKNAKEITSLYNNSVSGLANIKKINLSFC